MPPPLPKIGAQTKKPRNTFLENFATTAALGHCPRASQVTGDKLGKLRLRNGGNIDTPAPQRQFVQLLSTPQGPFRLGLRGRDPCAAVTSFWATPIPYWVSVPKYQAPLRKLQATTSSPYFPAAAPIHGLEGWTP